MSRGWVAVTTMSDDVITYPDQIMVYEPHGFVRLVDWMGDELSICNAARVSFHKESDWEYTNSEGGNILNTTPVLSKGDAGLINYLLKNHHGTPFEQGFMAQFHIRVPIFVMREWIRHRVGFSYNEESGRYVELRPDFYIPEEIRTQVGKPGAYTYEPINDRGKEEWFKGQLKYMNELGYDLYLQALDMGIAKEQARIFLMINIYTESRWTCNARSLMNFLALRAHKDAAGEIQTYAGAIEQIFAEKMPVTHGAFEAAGRVSP